MNPNLGFHAVTANLSGQGVVALAHPSTVTIGTDFGEKLLSFFQQFIISVGRYYSWGVRYANFSPCAEAKLLGQQLLGSVAET